MHNRQRLTYIILLVIVLCVCIYIYIYIYINVCVCVFIFRGYFSESTINHLKSYPAFVGEHNSDHFCSLKPGVNPCFFSYQMRATSRVHCSDC